MPTTRSITRRKLYERLWSEPTTKVAVAFGISDVGLAKLCKRHDIPRPPRGYWAQRQHGQTPPQEPLPRPEDDAILEFDEPAPPRPGSPPRPPRGKSELSRIAVGESLRGCHDLVSQANQELPGLKVDTDGLIVLGNAGGAGGALRPHVQGVRRYVECPLPEPRPARL